MWVGKFQDFALKWPCTAGEASFEVEPRTTMKGNRGGGELSSKTFGHRRGMKGGSNGNPGEMGNKREGGRNKLGGGCVGKGIRERPLIEFELRKTGRGEKFWGL